MKYFLQLLLICGLFLASCGEKPNRPDPILDDNYQPAPIQGAPAATTATPTPPNTPEPAQNAAGVWHYTCSNGCSGGAGSAVACATCGTTLVHNQAYHSANTTPGITATQNPAGTPPAPVTPAAPKTPEPAQNAAGVWHYTCSNGCSGGAGSAIACASCGSTLAHNQAYHQ